MVSVFSRKPHRVTDVSGLLFLMNVVRVVHVGAKEVFEPGVTIEARSVLSNLDHPAPDQLGWSVDGDGPGSNICWRW